MAALICGGCIDNWCLYWHCSCIDIVAAFGNGGCIKTGGCIGIGGCIENLWLYLSMVAVLIMWLY